MKHKCVWTIAAVCLIGIAALAAPSARAGQCSQATAAGTYGFTLTGWLILPTGAVPAAAAGRAVVDTKGNVTGTESRSVGGGFADETLSGTFVVNADCTGTMTISFYEAGSLVRTSVLSTTTCKWCRSP